MAQWIDRCMDELGFIYLTDKTRQELINHLSNQVQGKFDVADMDEGDMANILRLIASTPDYQRA